MVLIERRIYLEPAYLDENIMDHLFNKIVQTTCGECTQEYGYITGVKNIVKILNNEDTIFTVLFDAHTLKPELGSKLSGNICMVYKDGIFINVADRQKILIPASTLSDWKYDEVQSTYSKKQNTIKVGSNVNITVTASKFNKKGFICVGSLQE
jgi:DNA-directed RNA polymerase subunit E'/Rpb7